MIGLALGIGGCGTARLDGRDAAAGVRKGATSLRGLPERGNTLGDPDAPVTGTLFLRVSDLDAYLYRETLPRVIERFVRPGRMDLQLRTITDDSSGFDDTGEIEGVTRGAQAAGLAGLGLWRFLYAHQASAFNAEEPAATIEALRSLKADVAAVQRDAADPRVAAAIKRADRYARQAAVSAPALVIDPPKGADVRIDLASSPSASSVVRTIARALG